MKPFDDMIAEELEPGQEELVALLRQSYRKPVAVSSTGQEQVIARVRERLLQAKPELLSQDDMSVQRGKMLEPLPHKPLSSATPARTRQRRSGILRLVNALAAVLVVATLDGAALALFMHRSLSFTLVEAPPRLPSSTSVTAQTQKNGLVASMQLTPGPYFLSEMVAVDLSLTNHSTTVNADGSKTTTDAPDPFDKGLPSLTIAVNAKVPQNHQLSLKQEGTHVTVNAPAGAQLYLLYQYGVSCQRTQSTGSSQQNAIPTPLGSHFPIASTRNSTEITITGNYTWQPIKTNEVDAPSCPGTITEWTFAFGAPGYATVSGIYRP